MMSVEHNKEVVRRLIEEVLNEGDLDLVAELAVRNFVEHSPLPGQGDGVEGLRQRAEILRDGLDVHVEIEDVIGEGDQVVVRWTNSGTHIGTYRGFGSTGNSFRIAGIEVYWLRDGKLAAHWDLVDRLALFAQLGIVQLPAA
ncbi:MAG: ester cyclase [Actinomycetota bacterium]|nr:ester cyclase [Actinomycetota bacterium]